MTPGSKVSIAVLVLFGVLLGVYYGFGGPAPTDEVQPPAEAETTDQVVELPPAFETGALSRAVQRALADEEGATPVVQKPTAAGDAEPEPWVLKAPNLLETTPKPRPQAAPAAGSTEYFVREDDSLWTIAAAQLGDANRWSEIAAANPQVNPDRLRVGQRLIIPGKTPTGVAMNRPAAIASGTHTIRSGETLSSIAQRYLGAASRWREIYDANRDVIREGPNRIEVGMVLRIPQPTRSSEGAADSTPR